ncbi:MAG: ABC transporter permease subunit [Chitinivibrionales bacterium]|nr:ABC transporter permease subunit [Chitinivibrionales bacterium]
MFWTVVRKDLLRDVLSARAALLLVLPTVLVPLALVLGALESKSRLAEYAERVHMGEEIPQPHPLGFLAVGMDAEHFGNGLRGEILGFRARDLLSVVGTMLSLAAIVLGAVALTEERGSGLLKVALAGPLPRSTLIMARMFSGALGLNYPFVVACLVGALLVNLAGLTLSATQWATLGIAVAVCVLAMTTYYAMGLAASCCTRSGASASTIGLLVWGTSVLLAPIAISVGTQEAIESPSVQFCLQTQMNIYQELIHNRTKASPEFFARIKDVDQARTRQMVLQTKLSTALLTLLPSGALSVALTDLAGTGQAEFIRVLAPWAAGVSDALLSERVVDTPPQSCGPCCL